jgi:hypothetical protein
MIIKPSERSIYPKISEELKKKGFHFPITDEFGIKLDDYKRRVDVFGCRWNSDGLYIETIGIEAKYSPDESINREFSQGLSQCIDYLPFFKYVGLCSREEKIGQHLDMICKELTINRVTADFEKLGVGLPNELIECKFNNKDISNQVLLRSSMILSFYEAFKDKEINHGEFRDGGGWLAVNFKNNLQINTWYEEKTKWVYLGVNMERREPFKNLVRKLTKEGKNRLKPLFEENENMSLKFCNDRRAPNNTELIWENKPLSEIKNKEIDCLIDEIKKTLSRKDWRPHITIYVKLWDMVKDKQWHENKIKEEKNKLMKFIEFFEKLV